MFTNSDNWGGGVQRSHSWNVASSWHEKPLRELFLGLQITSSGSGKGFECHPFNWYVGQPKNPLPGSPTLGVIWESSFPCRQTEMNSTALPRKSLPRPHEKELAIKSIYFPILITTVSWLLPFLTYSPLLPLWWCLHMCLYSRINGSIGMIRFKPKVEIIYGPYFVVLTLCPTRCSRFRSGKENLRPLIDFLRSGTRGNVGGYLFAERWH